METRFDRAEPIVDDEDVTLRHVTAYPGMTWPEAVRLELRNGLGFEAAKAKVSRDPSFKAVRA